MEKFKREFIRVFRRIILVFALSSVIAAFLVGSALHYALTRMTLNNWKQQQKFVTLEFAPQCDFEIEEAQKRLEFLVKLPVFSHLSHIDQIDPALKGVSENIDVEKRNILKDLLASDKRFSSIFILTPNGDFYLSEPFEGQVKVKRQNFSERPYFKEVSRTKRSVISDSFIGGYGTLMVVVVVPVLNKAGGITSYLGGATYLTDLSRLVAKDRIGDFDSGFIVDRKGLLIAHSDIGKIKKQSREDYSEHPMVLKYLHKDPDRDSNPVVEKYVDPTDGKVYLSSFVRLRSGWGLGLNIEEKTVLSKTYFVVWQITILMSIIVLAVCAIGVLFVKRIGRRWEVAENDLLERTHDLGERVKELNGLYGISNLIENHEISLEVILRDAVELVPPSYQYPEITCARIVLQDIEYKTKNYRGTPWKQTRDILVHGDPVGCIEVCYLEQKPESIEGPFMKEERDLINAIAERLGNVIEYRGAEEKVRASLQEKETLLKEIHHRVKNNMNVTSSLLKLQSAGITDEKVLEIFKDVRNRIKTMALIHDKLYRSSDLAHIDFGEYIKDLVENQCSSYGRSRDGISIKVAAEKLFLEIDLATPCALIINELVSNAFKHAFPGNRKGEITVALSAINGDEAELIVTDDGVGFPADLDFENSELFGLYIIKLLVAQIEGTIDLDRDGGTTFRIRFKREIC